jgi:MYXO-CTERM domain-containing protein
MNKALAVIACALLAPHAHAVIVEGTELAPYTAVSNQLATSHGVIFSSLNYNAVTFTEIYPTLWGVYGCEPWALPSNGGWYNAPIFVSFVDPSDGVTPAVVGTFSANWGDGGGDFDAVDLRAYDLANNLILTQTFTGSTLTVISITAPGINRVEFWANTNVGSPTSDTGFDWIQYPTPQVPAPGALLGLAGLALLRRRR